MAAASGTISSPERQQKMESFEVRLAFLENSAAQDSKKRQYQGGPNENWRLEYAFRYIIDGLEALVGSAGPLAK